VRTSPRRSSKGLKDGMVKVVRSGSGPCPNGSSKQIRVEAAAKKKRRARYYKDVVVMLERPDGESQVTLRVGMERAGSPRSRATTGGQSSSEVDLERGGKG